MRLARICAGGTVVLATLVVGTTAPATTATARGNVVVNAGFELPLAASVTSCSQVLRSSVGNWRAYAQTAGYVPFSVTETAHSGRHSMEVQGPPLGTCSALAVFQDLPADALPTNQSFTFGFWMKPEHGSQTQEVIYGWREEPLDGHIFGVSEDMSQGSITVRAWGTTKVLRRHFVGNAWHHLKLSVDAETNTAMLSIDGKRAGATQAGSAFPAGRATVYLGQNRSVTTSGSNFYYDDVVVTR